MKSKINRRRLIRTGAIAAAGLTIFPGVISAGKEERRAQSSERRVKNGQLGNPVRLGGPVAEKFTDPAEWSKAIKSLGYSAAFCPVQPGADKELIKAFRAEAERSNIIIAEAGTL